MDLAWAPGERWFGDHQFVTSVAVEALLVVLTYVVIDSLLTRRQNAQLHRLWRDAAQPTITGILSDGWRVQSAAMSVGSRLTQVPVNPKEFAGAQQRLLPELDAYRTRLERAIPVLMAAPELAHFVPLAWKVFDEGMRLATVFRELLDAEAYARFDEAFSSLCERAGEDMQPLPRVPLGMQMQFANERRRFERTMRAWTDLPPLQ